MRSRSRKLNHSSATAPNGSPTDHNKKGSVIVVGAGLAGLAAAKKLVETGYDNVIVLEARDRVGGRIWTSSQWEDLPVDMGASWIHGTIGNPIANLAKMIDSPLHCTSYNRTTTYDTTTGQPLTKAQESRLSSHKQELLKLLRKAQDHDDDVSIRKAVKPILERYDKGSEERRFFEFLFQSEFETEYSGSVDELSTYWYDSDKQFTGGDALFEAGYRVITDHLATGLHIELGQVVTEIRWQDSSSVNVMTQQSEFWADHVIITLPLGVLKQETIQFSPSLPKQKETAIAELGMGVLNKCYLRFAEPFWSDKVDWIECISMDCQWTEWVSLLRSVKAPVLLGFNAAHRAREIEDWTDEQTVESAMETLRSVFGEDIPDPIDFQVTRWASDPFSCGSYSFNAIGSHPGMRKVLAAPVGRVLFFAGEATEHRYFGTAHGAYLSGIRAAEDVADVMTK